MHDDGALARAVVDARFEAVEAQRVAVGADVGIGGPEESEARLVAAVGVREPRREVLSAPAAVCDELLEEYLRAFEGDSSVQAVRTLLAERLLDLFRRTSDSKWPWFEDRVTSSNARLPQALIVSGAWMQNEEMSDAGTRSLQCPS